MSSRFVIAAHLRGGRDKMPKITAALFFMVIATGALLPAQCFAQSTAAKTPEQQDAENISELVLANHIIADQGVVD